MGQIRQGARIGGGGSTQFWQCQDFGCIWTPTHPLQYVLQMKTNIEIKFFQLEKWFEFDLSHGERAKAVVVG